MIVANVSFVLVLSASLYAFSSNNNSQISASVPSIGEVEKTNPLDTVSSADIAVNVSRISRLDEGVAVANAADTMNAQIAVSSNDNVVLSKPQVISGTAKSKKDIKKYVTVQGDTVSTVANKFGVTSDTIRISNGLNTEIIPAGKELIISPVNGVVYTVKAGDTPDSIASAYRANKDQLIAFNDAEITGTFKVGEVIVVPEGTVVPQAQARAGTSGLNAGRTVGFSFGEGPVYGGSNGYAYGYCTYWAALRRAQVGMPVPSNLGNAVSWKTLAARAGLGVGNVPRQNAVIWFPTGGYGHVGFVESVNADGSANISEMNAAGWNRVSRATIPAGEVSKYGYIY